MRNCRLPSVCSFERSLGFGLDFCFCCDKSHSVFLCVFLKEIVPFSIKKKKITIKLGAQAYCCHLFSALNSLPFCLIFSGCFAVGSSIPSAVSSKRSLKL